MKQLSFSVIALLAACTNCMAEEKNLTSPDGKMTVSINDEGGVPTYRVDYAGSEFISSSPLGLMTNMGDYSKNMTFSGFDTSTVKESYDLRIIKQSHVDYEANQAVCSFTQDGKKVMDIIFRVSNRDVAFRYRVYPKGETRVCVVNEEASSFTLPEGTTTFLCPQSRPMGGFARTSPSYETSYTLDDAMGKNGWGEGYSFPCLFRVGDKGWALISETGVDGKYVASRLLNNTIMNIIKPDFTPLGDAVDVETEDAD